jgi:hypothetical protein
VETKAHLCFFKNGRGGRGGCVYGTKGAVDRKSLGATAVDKGVAWTREKR